MEFEISVIIPVYNAVRFLEKAVVSAVDQEQVVEVLAVDDGSTDGSYELLIQLEKKYNKLILLIHCNHANKGRSATRNLGINYATGNFIAFLDADDFYLENRFEVDRNILMQYPNCEGVYNAIGVEFYRAAIDNEEIDLELYSIKEYVPPNDLFKTIFDGGKGHFSIIGLTLATRVFSKVGLFVDTFRVGEDTDLFFKLSLKCKLLSGELDVPVAIRGVHDKNVFDQKELYYENSLHRLEALIFWSSQNNIDFAYIEEMLKRFWLIRFKKSSSLIKDTWIWAKMFFNNRRILFSYLSLKYFPLIRKRKVLFPFFFHR
eukprot:TRINITY_DN67518_c0_g1_i1.p2 TRINITY_DN67518_c0_g1~~TRINITY_DN67518_c0_g1_i1.p2  ORF type:complete len:317 (+),score=-22.85 TRINITY_DN67518_c0_g1_i1:379-1329(+)